MALEPKLSHTAALILQAIHAGHVYGFSVMERTGLPSGTVYPAMRRLERDSLIRSQWEAQSIADAAQRPPRKYYKLTRSGKGDAGGFAEALSAARQADPVAGGRERMTPLHLAILRSAACWCPARSAPSGSPSGAPNSGT